MVNDRGIQMKEYWKRFLLFLKNLPATIKESFIWFLMTYAFPLVQIFIIWGIKQDNFEWSLEIMKIVLVTNASLYTSILMVVNSQRKDKRVVNILTILTYIFTIVLFAIAMVEITKNMSIFSLGVYQYGTIATFSLALFFGLISKYDEVKANSVELANSGMQKSEAIINGQKIDI
jgi:hypothetical protein